MSNDNENKQIDEEGERRISMEKFRKGPWRIEEFRDFASIMAGYTEICYIDDDFNCDKVRANARLITAAPEMYELLGRVEDYFQNRHIQGYGVEESVSTNLLTQIKEVMKKVRGEK